jgi:hypothetical protein
MLAAKSDVYIRAISEHEKCVHACAYLSHYARAIVAAVIELHNSLTSGDRGRGEKINSERTQRSLDWSVGLVLIEGRARTPDAAVLVAAEAHRGPPTPIKAAAPSGDRPAIDCASRALSPQQARRPRVHADEAEIRPRRTDSLC